MKSYPELNNYINSKLGDGEICAGRSFNYIKIFQHALSYSLNNSKRKLLRQYFHFPKWFQYILLFIRKVAVRSNSVQLNALVLLAENRTKTKPNGTVVSFYFDEIIEGVDAERRTVINSGSILLQCDYHIKDLAKCRIPPDSQEIELLWDINYVIAKTESSGLFSRSELYYLKSCFHVFYDEFRFYYSLFKNQKVRKVILTCHYHKEGLLSELRILGIESVELQHGLIASNDIYYVYPHQYKSIISGGLFPNKIGVYGVKWKELLLRGCEFTEDRIDVVGEYFDIGEKVFSSVQKENLIIVCSQKNLDADYLAYLKHLDTQLSNHPGWQALVKLHPLEKRRDLYLMHSFRHVEIADVDLSLKELLARARVQISIYSTTFFDALGYNVLNMSLQDYGYSREYAREILAMGVAMPCQFNEDPVELYYKFKDSYQLPSRNDFYANTTLDDWMNWVNS